MKMNQNQSKYAQLLYFLLLNRNQNMSLLSRLPAYYRNNPAFLQIAKHIVDSPCRYSGLFLTQKDDMHLLLKDGSIHVQLDWQAFSLMRATSSLIVASGQILRNEPGVFKTQQDYNNNNIKQLYDAYQTNHRQKLFIFSRKLNLQQLKQQVNQKKYQILQLPKYNTVHEAISQLYQKENLPMTVEFGMDLLNQYFNEVIKGGRNYIDTLLISKFTAENIDSKYIGPKFAVPIHKFYQPVWKSVSFPCEMSNGQKGHLNMEIHSLK